MLYPLEGTTEGFPRNVSFEVADIVDLFGLGLQQQQQELEYGGDDEMAVDSPEPIGSPRQNMQHQQRKRQTSINGSSINVTAQYDAVLLLSVLKWIHIHNSDAILPLLFAAINNALSPGGVLVVEVQDWESYEKAAKKNPGLKGKVQALKVRKWEEIVDAILKVGFEVVGEVEEKRDVKGKIRRRRMVGFGKV